MRATLPLILLYLSAPAPTQAPPDLQWGTLPDMPVPLSGHFAGIVSNRLVIIGGAHFPTPLFEGGTKVWESAAYSIKPGEPGWTYVSDLPGPSSYGASLTHGRGMICLGGSDGEKHYRDVRLVTHAMPPDSPGPPTRLRSPGLQWVGLPPLPKPCAFTSAALLGDHIYVAGGQEAPDSTEAMRNFWRLDLGASVRQWQELEPWPGPARILCTAAAHDGAFYLFGGCDLSPDDDGKAKRTYLTDAYRYVPDEGWEKLADMPRPAVAAPSPAPVVDGHVLLLGGDDGENAGRVQELKDNHPGFRHDILAYDAARNRWTTAGDIPSALVTTTVVPMPYGFVIPGGEDRPGHRSAEVMRAKPARKDEG